MDELERCSINALKAVRNPLTGKRVYEDAALTEDEIIAMARAIIPMVLEEAAKQVEALPAAEIYCGVKSVWLRDALAAIRAIGAP